MHQYFTYTIACFHDLHSAEDRLESMFAEGDVCEGEHPRIIRQGDRWAITVTIPYLLH